eukprot:2573819-Pleurochrysis_carterae.AAC.6
MNQFTRDPANALICGCDSRVEKFICTKAGKEWACNHLDCLIELFQNVLRLATKAAAEASGEVLHRLTSTSSSMSRLSHTVLQLGGWRALCFLQNNSAKFMNSLMMIDAAHDGRRVMQTT